MILDFLSQYCVVLCGRTIAFVKTYFENFKKRLRMKDLAFTKQLRKTQAIYKRVGSKIR